MDGRKMDMHVRRTLFAALIVELLLIGLAPAPTAPAPTDTPITINIDIDSRLYFSAPVSSLTLDPPATDTGMTWTGTISGCSFGSNNPDGFDITVKDDLNGGFLVSTVNGPLKTRLDMKYDGDHLWKTIPASAPFEVSLHHFDQGEYTSQVMNLQQIVKYIDKPDTYEGTITFAVSDTV